MPSSIEYKSLETFFGLVVIGALSYYSLFVPSGLLDFLKLEALVNWRLALVEAGARPLIEGLWLRSFLDSMNGIWGRLVIDWSLIMKLMGISSPACD